MGWLDKLKNWGSAPDLPAAAPQRQDLDFASLGLQAYAPPAKMLDPNGKRVYHEHFVGEDRGDGHFPWTCRVYDAGGLRAEKSGLATSHDVSTAQATSWADKTKTTILGMP